MVESTEFSLALLPKEDQETIISIHEESEWGIRSISKEGIVELKNNSQPSELCQLVGKALLIMFGETDK